jgi:hypothetical protein
LNIVDADVVSTMLICVDEDMNAFDDDRVMAGQEREHISREAELEIPTRLAIVNILTSPLPISLSLRFPIISCKNPPGVLELMSDIEIAQSVPRDSLSNYTALPPA